MVEPEILAALTAANAEHAELDRRRTELENTRAAIEQAAAQREAALIAASHELATRAQALQSRVTQLEAGVEVALAPLVKAKKVVQTLVRAALAAVGFLAMVLVMAPEAHGYSLLEVGFGFLVAGWFLGDLVDRRELK